MRPLLALITLATTALPAGQGSQDALQAPSERSFLRVGMDPRAAPTAFVPGVDFSREDPRKAPTLTPAQLGRIEGLEVDVMNALARRIGVEARVVPTSWYALEAALLEGRFDVILSSWTPHEHTPKGIAASIPYYEWGLLVAVRADDSRIRSIPDLAGLRVGHIPDPAVQRALSEMGKGLGTRAAVIRDNGDLLFDDLESRTIDALIFDSLYVRWRVSRDRSFRVVGEPLNRLGYHVGVRREDSELLRKINAAIRDLAGSEEMHSIRRTWEGPP